MICGECCGVDSEMETLAQTGCYADFTLPSVPYQTQVPRINSIYECGGRFCDPIPHRKGTGLKQGSLPRLPVIFTGPLVFDWSRRVRGMVVPRLDDGVMAFNYPMDLNRLNRWSNAHISVGGKPDWVFIKLYCHGFFPQDQDTVIGDRCRRFFEEALEESARTNQFKIHFATAREAFNIAMAAVDGHGGEPYVTDPHSEFGKAAQRALAAAFPDKPLALIREGGSIPIVNTFKKVLGVETLLLGLALPDCRAHAPDENFPIENFEAGIRLNRALLEELGR